MNHDEHYRKIEAQGVEPIVSMESVACLGLPQELTAIIKRNLNLALAVKHITRCGEKDGQEASTEIDKAQNYLTRAKTGQWRPVATESPYGGPDDCDGTWAKGWEERFKNGPAIVDMSMGGEIKQPVSVEPDPMEKMQIGTDKVGRIFRKGLRVRSTLAPLTLEGTVIGVSALGCAVQWDGQSYEDTLETFANLEILPKELQNEQPV